MVAFAKLQGLIKSLSGPLFIGRRTACPRQRHAVFPCPPGSRSRKVKRQACAFNYTSCSAQGRRCFIRGADMQDPILELIVKFAESDAQLETAVTLVVDGFLISGFVISRAQYMQHHILTSSIEQGIKDALAAGKPSDDGARAFIHLRDAMYFTPGQDPVPANESVVCRIGLDRVSAFHLGFLESI